MTMTIDPPKAARLFTAEEVLAMPEDGIDRELIRGELRETEMTRRNPSHSTVEMTVGAKLWIWLMSRPEPRGRIVGGEAGFRIRRNPDTLVGIDVAYVDAATSARIPKNASIIEGPPVLAVEILSPSDKQRDILQKVEEYLAAGTKVVLVLEPVFETVTIFRPDALPVLLTGPQELTMEPHLAGFRCVAKEFFI